MSNSTLVNLATVGSDELQTMPAAMFTAGLEQMSADAIVRFRRMRKLNETQKAALERFLSEHPEKRPGGQAGPAPAAQKNGKPAEQAKKKPAEATLWMDMLLRMIAWWEGMDTDSVARAKGIKRWKRKKKAKPQAEPAPAPAPAPVAAKEKEERKPLTRIELVQKLWGEGFSLPGGKDFALRIASPANCAKGSRCLDLTPGLGGGTRAVAKAFGVTVAGIEPDEEFAQAASEFSEREGMSDAAPIRAAGLDGLERQDFEPAGEHAAIFMREAMFAVEERERMLAAMHKALEDNGSLVLTDFVLAENAGGGTMADAVAHWMAAEPHVARPWTEAEYREALAAQDYKMERFEDLTGTYLPFVKEGLRRFHDCLQNAKFPPETVTTLMREGNIWLARSQALETGQLSFVHIHARRVSPAPGRESEAREPEAAPEDEAVVNDE